MSYQTIIVGIAGGTGSGKTSVTQAIIENLERTGIHSILLEQDSYYKRNDHLTYEQRTKLNYDHPDAIDFDLLEKHILALKDGKSIEKPIYDFQVHNRINETQHIEPANLIIVEGILVLAIAKIRNLFDTKIFVDTDDDERLLRRIERDLNERARSFESVKNQYINTVKPMHLEFVEPSKRYADVIIPRGKDNKVGIKMVASRLRYLFNKLNKGKLYPLEYEKIEGLDGLEKVINIDQTPIGRTPRSNPATYTGVFTPIRDLFAGLKEAKIRGFSKRRFSFNLQGGRCEACKGDGIIKIEMHFLPDVYVPCDVCGGMRYNQETLKVKYKDKSIFDVLDMSVDEAKVFFENIPTIKRILDTISDVGLGYIRLGQPSTQLSGGEAQRIKLASELAKKSTGRTLYILDEPTTGLHFADVDKLIAVLERLTDTGNTVVVIEHNLDVIKRADHIIDLGPDGGSNGGEIVATGTPLEVSKVKKSYTGHYLQQLLK